MIAEFSYARYANLKLKRELQTVVAGNTDLEILPSIKLKEKPIESYSDLVNRPLFNNTRRIIKEVTIPPTVIKQIIKTANFKHELIGIFGSQSETNALFRNKSPRNMKNKNQRFFTVKVGEYIDGWQIKKINTNTVIIENNGKTETIAWSKYKPRLFKTLKKPIKNKLPKTNNPFKRKLKSSAPKIPVKK